jgi:ATP-dependent helicase/DNAse subunit B
MAWLKIEKTRVPFELHHSEYNTEVEINGLQVKCRIDRIDEINDIGFAIIDYKSGAHSPNEWFGPRPDQPQMPIYALAEQNKLIAVVYANLKPGSYGFSGVSQLKESFPTLKAFDDLGENQRRGLTWEGLIPYWREQLSALAEDYQNGYAVPDPKKGLATCRYCELETLCRVNATSNLRVNAYEDDNV